MMRTTTIVSAFLLATGSLSQAEDRESALPDLGPKSHEYQHSVDMTMSLHEYEGMYSRNQKVVLKNLRSYSENTLVSIGIPRQGINLMGAALGLAFSDSKLNLNESKTLALEIKDARDSDRSFYLGVNLDW
jgi:hypothetical protein